jgi:hypothetical protein
MVGAWRRHRPTILWPSGFTGVLPNLGTNQMQVEHFMPELRFDQGSFGSIVAMMSPY